MGTELLTRCRDFRNLWKKHGPSPLIPTAIELRKRRPLGALACLKFRFGLCASPLPHRGCVLQPRVGAAPTLGKRGHDDVNPERVVAMSRPRGNERRNPVGVGRSVAMIPK